MANAKIKVTHEEWDKLSDPQRELLRKIGVCPARETARDRLKKKFFDKAKPYTLGIYSKCTLCGAEWSQKWRMVPLFDYEAAKGYWHGKLIGNGNLILEDKRDDRIQITCSSCFERLSQVPKDKLIRQLVIYARYAATWGGGKKA